MHHGLPEPSSSRALRRFRACGTCSPYHRVCLCALEHVTRLRCHRHRLSHIHPSLPVPLWDCVPESPSHTHAHRQQRTPTVRVPPPPLLPHIQNTRHRRTFSIGVPVLPCLLVLRRCARPSPLPLYTHPHFTVLFGRRCAFLVLLNATRAALHSASAMLGKFGALFRSAKEKVSNPVPMGGDERRSSGTVSNSLSGSRRPSQWYAPHSPPSPTQPTAHAGEDSDNSKSPWCRSKRPRQ